MPASVEGENEDEVNDNNEDAHEIEGTGPVLTVGSNSFVMELSQRQVTVIVSSATDFDGGLHSLADLKVGMQVEIRGTLQSNGAIAASRVHGEDNHDGDGHGGDGGGDDHGGGSGSGDGSSGHGGSDDPAESSVSKRWVAWRCARELHMGPTDHLSPGESALTDCNRVGITTRGDDCATDAM